MVTHRINRVEFELEVSAVELGRRVSDRVSMLHGQRIVGLLDRVCSEVDDAEQIDRIDTLELDLGSIALASFDDELLGKLEAALRQALRERPRLRTRAQQGEGDRPDMPDASGSSERPDAQRRADHAHELLDGYAWTGSLPWWADASENGVLARHVRDLLVHAPARWLELLREHAEDRVGLDRLARGWDDELFEVILERAGAGASLSDLRVLDRLLARAGARGTTLRVELLGAIGRHGRLEPSTVLLAAVRELDAEVVAALAELVDEETGRTTAAVRVAIASVVASPRMREPPSQDRVDATTEVRAALDRVGASIDLDARAASPHSAEALASTSHATTSHATTSHATTSHASTPTALQPEHARRHPGHAPAPARAPAEDPQLQHARRRALARLDELYIEDAGLVILWPFIERLFTRVELLDAHRRFRDDAAQTTAIALLGYLAAADPNPLEHQLAFAKLLCGRSPEQPCPLQDPLERELCDECDLLLAAVIDHAPILDNMPIPRFRASFLQRTGALSVRTGSWLLAVERQPYDLVLERFSWSWAWVKFPWMPEALTVEW